ncbi:hypothetical protein WJX84_004796 [Apatococcus fuscideae]|uniref:Thymidine kinase n=1 Tax=Apatococcus fuscideae TaxID=2026836 RepID=A0AAW1T232_9CHLO
MGSLTPGERVPRRRPVWHIRPAAQIARHHTQLLCTAAGSSSSEAATARHTNSATAGQLDLIIGPMFAGKTSALLKRVNDLEAQGLTVVAIKSAKDTRYHASRLVTHDGQSRECFAASSLAEFKEHQASEYRASQAIAIDEAQFFPDLLEFCLEAAERDNKLVVVAGLSGDFRRKRFGEVLDLVPLDAIAGPLALSV